MGQSHAAQFSAAVPDEPPIMPVAVFKNNHGHVAVDIERYGTLPKRDGRPGAKLGTGGPDVRMKSQIRHKIGAKIAGVIQKSH